jgi:acetolactate synthase-1/3 small subunit
MIDIKKRIITILIDNEFGSLARVVELFSGRGYNIDSLNVAPVSYDKKISRITITTICDQKTIDLVRKLLERLIPVYRTVELTSQNFIERELALVKIIDNNKDISQKMLDKYQAKILNEKAKKLIIEIVNNSKAINNFINEIQSITKIDSISRTGTIANFDS